MNKKTILKNLDVRSAQLLYGPVIIHLFLLKVILVVFVIFFFLLPDVVLYPSEMLHHAGVHTRLLGVSAFLEKKNS